MTVLSIGTATLYLGDARKIRPTLGFMHADILDPPYLFNNSGGGAYRAARGASDQIVAERLDRGFDHSIIDPNQSGAVVVFCHNDQLGELIPALVEDEGGDFDALIVGDMFTALRQKFHRAAVLFWAKPNPPPHRNKHYLADTEPFIHAWNPGYAPVGDHHDMHRYIIAQSTPSKLYGHPTVKPDAVMDEIVRNVAGNRIADPYMGSGSTGVAAIKAGKQFFGIEHNEKHFATAVARITAAVEDQRFGQAES